MDRTELDLCESLGLHPDEWYEVCLDFERAIVIGIKGGSPLYDSFIVGYIYSIKKDNALNVIEFRVKPWKDGFPIPEVFLKAFDEIQ